VASTLDEQAVVKFVGRVVEVKGGESKIELKAEFCPGLFRLSQFSHLIVLYWLHLRDNEADRGTLRVIPMRHADAPEMGVFGTRSPSRPNPIGLCVVELLRLEDCSLIVKSLDAEEGSPIIDIKPYIPRADSLPEAKVPEWALKGPTT